MRYGLNDFPPPLALFLYGLQWWIVTLPSVVILGAVVTRLHFVDVAAQIWYMQKLLVVLGTATVVQVLIGHRLPLVIGPAATLLVGILASVAEGVDALYTAIFLGGIVLAIAGFSGMLAHLRVFFTTRIVAVVLVLIAFTLSPTILRLIGEGSGGDAFPFCFALATVFALLCINNILKGMFKSLTVPIGLIGGTLAFCLFRGVPESFSALPKSAAAFSWTISPEFHPGTLMAFVFCFLALIVNELGSIEAVGQMLNADSMDRRTRQGVGFAGLANAASGWFGVIGSVDYSLSAGLITATGCASRFALVPAGIGLVLCGFFPKFVMVLGAIPGPVMGALLLYLMAAQLTSGLMMLAAEKGVTDFTSGMVVGLPLMIGIIISFAPANVFNAFPEMLRSVIGNGFVAGTLAVIILEHGVFRKR
jgi:xanthine/uracil permease